MPERETQGQNGVLSALEKKTARRVKSQKQLGKEAKDKLGLGKRWKIDDKAIVANTGVLRNANTLWGPAAILVQGEKKESGGRSRAGDLGIPSKIQKARKKKKKKGVGLNTKPGKNTTIRALTPLIASRGDVREGARCSEKKTMNKRAG